MSFFPAPSLQTYIERLQGFITQMEIEISLLFLDDMMSRSLAIDTPFGRRGGSWLQRCAFWGQILPIGIQSQVWTKIWEAIISTTYAALEARNHIATSFYTFPLFHLSTLLLWCSSSLRCQDPEKMSLEMMGWELEHLPSYTPQGTKIDPAYVIFQQGHQDIGILEFKGGSFFFEINTRLCQRLWEISLSLLIESEFGKSRCL